MALAELQETVTFVVSEPHEPAPDAPPILRTLITGWTDDQLASVVNAANIAGFKVGFENFDDNGMEEIALTIGGKGDCIEFYIRKPPLSLSSEKPQKTL